VPVVSQLFVYPIKSCRGISVDAAEVGPRGLQHDRRWMLVDANGRFLTQRRQQRMALIDVGMSAGSYTVSAPGMALLTIPAALDDTDGLAECEVRIWKDTVPATMAPPEINVWFSEFMGFACGLVHLAEHQHRPVQNEAAAFDDEVSFADSAPVLLLSSASLDELNRRLDQAVSIRQFRPNLVVTADRPHAEDSWQAIEIGQARFAVAWSCARCILTTVNPDTGEKHPGFEPMTTLKTYRLDGREVMFGRNLIPQRLGRIAVGDELRIEPASP
jgi:uncharacterized protein YcbX